MSPPAPLRLYVVCDGPRDHAAVCRITGRVVGRAVDPECEHWPRLHKRGSGRGYGRKLKYAVRQAIANRQAGVVATVDRDKHGPREKLDELCAARAEDRAKAVVLPTALGEASPHFEAWLLDDPAAVREALSLPPQTEVTSVSRAKNPKGVLDELISRAVPDRQGREAEILAEIAVRLDVTRCTHATETGLQAFVEDLQAEFGPLAAGSRGT